MNIRKEIDMGDFIQDYLDQLVKGKKDECWPWTGMIGKQGYGLIRRNNSSWDKRLFHVHEIAYALAHPGEASPAEQGKVLTHTCGLRSCCNPDHIKAVERWETSWEAQKTHCIRGHELPEPKEVCGRIVRVCVECRRIRQRELYKKNKAEVFTLGQKSEKQFES
jgi:hypothetical protein